MSIITSMTRMWLTRSLHPFTFTNEYDETLPFAECKNTGLYVHIPFCKSICNFCPYCKVRYSKELCDKYIDALLKEIHLVGSQCPEKKKVTSLYFGGGHRLWQLIVYMKLWKLLRSTLSSLKELD